MVSLSLGWNGFQRLMARGRRGFPNRPGFPRNPAANAAPDSTSRPGPAQEAQGPASAGPMAGPASSGAGPATQGQGRRRGGGFMDNGTPGPFRLADKNLAGQVGWFLPMALLGCWAAARRSPRAWPLSPEHQTLLFWLVWFFTYAAVFSFMKGAMHPYYLVLLVPAIASLTGIGFRALWLDFEEGKRLFLPLGLLLTAAWQTFIVNQYPDWRAQLLPILLLGVALSGTGLFILGLRAPASPWLKSLGGLGFCALLLCPAFWCLTPILGSGQSVEANPDLVGRTGGGMFQGLGQNLNLTKPLAFLRAHRQGESYLVVAQNSQLVAPLIIQSGEPAVAIGGFMGADPILTANEFAQLVQEGRFRYMLLNAPNPNPARAGAGNGRGLGGGFGRGGYQADIAKWVREHGKPVDSALWKPDLPPALAAPQTQAGAFGGRRGGLANLQLYDLRPDLEIKTASAH